MKTFLRDLPVFTPIRKDANTKTFFLFILTLVISFLAFCPLIQGADRSGTSRLATEQEIAAEKFFSSLETALAKKFFDYRNRPIIRVAVFDFTDGSGNVVKAGRELADKITRRLYLQDQFDVISQEKMNRYLNWNGLSVMGKLDAQGLHRLQRRINTMDPANGINALITGEVQKGVSRSLRISVSLVNFQFNIGAMEMEKNIVDVLPMAVEIPLPTEQALQEATEIVLRGEIRPLEEGRLLILANNRGNALRETEYAKQFTKERPFPWAQVPFVFVAGKEEVTIPEQVKVGLGELLLSPISIGNDSKKQLEFSFLHGKCSTNVIYFDEILPAQSYRLITSFLDLKNNDSYSESMEVQVLPGTTTIVVLSVYVPNEKERIRTRQTPRINVFQLWGKGMEALPDR
ncbi:MAG: hypothetical protein OEW45_09640 [Deltaproteobacteria bacterium]|nr:hypothetical protein [Deltaproteobacteria bacterium]